MASMVTIHEIMSNIDTANILIKGSQRTGNIKPNIVICSHLMEKYIETKMNMKLSHVQRLIIMTCYLKNGNYSDAIKAVKSPNIKLFALKMISYISIMKIESEHEKTKYYFNLITDSIEWFEC